MGGGGDVIEALGVTDNDRLWVLDGVRKPHVSGRVSTVVNRASWKREVWVWLFRFFSRWKKGKLGDTPSKAELSCRSSLVVIREDSDATSHESGDDVSGKSQEDMPEIYSLYIVCRQGAV